MADAEWNGPPPDRAPGIAGGVLRLSVLTGEGIE